MRSVPVSTKVGFLFILYFFSLGIIFFFFLILLLPFPFRRFFSMLVPQKTLRIFIVLPTGSLHTPYHPTLQYRGPTNSTPTTRKHASEF